MARSPIHLICTTSAGSRPVRPPWTNGTKYHPRKAVARARAPLPVGAGGVGDPASGAPGPGTPPRPHWLGNPVAAKVRARVCGPPSIGIWIGIGPPPGLQSQLGAPGADIQP